jgi:hypothetical protein
MRFNDIDRTISVCFIRTCLKDISYDDKSHISHIFLKMHSGKVHSGKGSGAAVLKISFDLNEGKTAETLTTWQARPVGPAACPIKLFTVVINSIAC